MDFYEYNLATPEEYDEYNDFYGYEYEQSNYPKNVKIVYETCVKPSIIHFSEYVIILLGGALLCRLIWSVSCVMGNNEWIKHLASFGCGMTMLVIIHKIDALVLLFVVLLAFLVILLYKYRYGLRHIGMVTLIIVIASNLLHELYWNLSATWQRIRGTRMIFSMKIISFAFDIERHQIIESRSQIEPGLFAYLGYIFCPATCVLGPWVPYSVYWQNLKSLYRKRIDKTILWTVLNVTTALFLLGISNCLTLFLLNNYIKWIQIYILAITVRCSHYMICFVSQATVAIFGFTLNDKRPINPILGHIVSAPWHIEFPRSMSSVVRYWNLPMHDWLKTYIFQPIYVRSRSYILAAILSYLISSLLHGYDLRIYIVLVSIVCIAYTENCIRAKLANIFDACIAAEQCRQPCIYANCHRQRAGKKWTVLFVNIAFSILTILHLAYLGIALHNDDNDAEEEGAVQIALSKWSDLCFIPHWIALGSLIFNWCI